MEASGTSTCAKAGLGLFTVRAQSQAITVSFLPNVFLQVWPLFRHLRRDLDLGVEVADALFGLVAHPLTVIADIFGQPCAPFHLGSDSFFFLRDSGFTGGRPANFGGISIMALLISTATGFRSLA